MESMAPVTLEQVVAICLKKPYVSEVNWYTMDRMLKMFNAFFESRHFKTRAFSVPLEFGGLDKTYQLAFSIDPEDVVREVAALEVTKLFVLEGVHTSDLLKKVNTLLDRVGSQYRLVHYDYLDSSSVAIWEGRESLYSSP